MNICHSCPRHCVVDRDRDAGFCGATTEIVVASHCLHRGEEPVISGTRGSGTVFFSHCNLRCLFCQNHDISWEGVGTVYSDMQLIACMLDLQTAGAHNINFVSPSQYACALPRIIHKARDAGLRIPIVYNTNGYDDVEMLRDLDGLIDIYLPDIKYSNNSIAEQYSACSDYVERSHEAVSEMFRQVGPLVCDEAGIAQKGMLVRHLVLPEDAAGSRETLDFLASLSTDIPLSIMAQYHPCYRAREIPALRRTITEAEYAVVITYAEALGFDHIFGQELSSHDTYLPDFYDEEHPFE